MRCEVPRNQNTREMATLLFRLLIKVNHISPLFFNVENMSFNVLCENEILANIFEFKVLWFSPL